MANKNTLYDNDPDKTLGVPDEELDRRFNEIIKIIKAENKLKGLPTQEYDFRSKKAYLLYPDGRREYANG